MSITNLPNELIILILRNNDYRDIVNFGSTCKGFNNLIKNNDYLWREKFKELIPEHIFRIVSMCSWKRNWFQEIIFFYTIKKNIYAEIMLMSPKYYCQGGESMRHDVKNVFNNALSNNVSYYYTIYILQDLIRKGHEFVDKNTCVIPYTLTEMYYAKILLQHLMYAFLSIKWIQMQMKQQLTPEVVLCLFIQWIDVVKIHSDEDIKVKILDVVKEVEALVTKNHPATTKHALKLHEKVAQKLITQRKVLEAITEVIYHQRGMQVTSCASLETFDIEQVLTRNCGNIFVVAIIYYFVAKQCGVHCGVVIFPHHFFVEWRDTSLEHKPQRFTLDIYTGAFRPQRVCPFSGSRRTESYDYCPNSLLRCIIRSFETMSGVTSNRLTYNTMQLLCLVEDPPYDNTYYYYRCYLENTTSLSSLATIDLNYIQNDHRHHLSSILDLTDISSQIRQTVKRVKKPRDNRVKYAVGMVCFNNVHHYDCVIIGWDPSYGKEEMWEGSPAIQDLELGLNQPFYFVASDDQSKRYVAQEKLTHKTHPTRLHRFEDMLSRYFTHFNGFAYVPNKEHLEVFPYDIHVSDMYRDRMQNKTGIEF